MTSGSAVSNTSSARSRRPLKSGTRISIFVAGELWRTARMQSTKWPAPPSFRSSRSTLVITTYARPSAAIVRARCSGSCGSGASGRPWATSQNGQRRVQRSPRIMKVAVPFPKHSPMLGQEASSHTVCRLFSRRMRLMSWKREPGEAARTRIHAGLARRSDGASAIGMRVFARPFFFSTAAVIGPRSGGRCGGRARGPIPPHPQALRARASA